MSSKPVLYYAPRSPPSRAVLLTAAALGVELDLRTLNVKAGENRTPEFLKLNPQHTIPVLDDNGTVVTDSHVICAYLADKYAVNETLYPKTPAERRLVDARLYYDCGHLFPRVRFIVEPIIYSGVGEIPADRVSYVEKAYDGLEHILAAGPYLAGEHLTIADLCAVSSVSTGAEFAPIDPAKFPKVIKWLELMKALPYYQKWNQEGLDLMVKVISDLLAERQQAKA